METFSSVQFPYLGLREIISTEILVVGSWLLAVQHSTKTFTCLDAVSLLQLSLLLCWGGTRWRRSQDSSCSGLWSLGLSLYYRCWRSANINRPGHSLGDVAGSPDTFCWSLMLTSCWSDWPSWRSWSGPRWSPTYQTSRWWCRGGAPGWAGPRRCWWRTGWRCCQSGRPWGLLGHTDSSRPPHRQIWLELSQHDWLMFNISLTRTCYSNPCHFFSSSGFDVFSFQEIIPFFHSLISDLFFQIRWAFPSMKIINCRENSMSNFS